MNLLKTVLTDSFTVLMRNFTLLYPILFFYLLLHVLMPADMAPSLEPRTLSLLGLILLISFAFMAGGQYMIYRACRHYLLFEKPVELQQAKEQTPPSEGEQPLPPPALLNSFLLLREFFPGVGEFFLRFTLGGLLHLTALAGIILAVKRGMDTLPLTQHLFSTMQELASQDVSAQAAAQRFILNLNVSERAQLTQIANYTFLGLSSYVIFWLLTMFWPAFAIVQQRNAFGAYWQSLRQFLKDPIRVLLLGGFFISVNLLEIFALQLAGANVFLVSLLQFLSLIFHVYFSVVLFMYVIQARGLPPKAEAEETAQQAGESRTESTPV